MTSDAMVQKKRAEASEKVAIENEAVAKKFLSTMSHELRTPLNSILAVSELMMLDLDIENEDPSAPLLPKKGSSSSSVVPSPPSPSTALPSPTTFTSSSPSENSSQFRDCELIHDSARFLKQIVDDVLDFNKIEMGCLVISPNRFSPALALQSVARLATPLIKDPSLYFHLNVDPTTPKTAKTDEHRFKQIIMNLASNAIKFIKEGGLTISLSTVNLTSFVQESLSPSEFQEWTDRLTDCPSMRLQEMATENSGELFIFVDVKDTGPGMTKQQRQEIFQPFFQSDPRRDAQAGGSGLGLSICADLCKVFIFLFFIFYFLFFIFYFFYFFYFFFILFYFFGSLFNFRHWEESFGQQTQKEKKEEKKKERGWEEGEQVFGFYYQFGRQRVKFRASWSKV